MTKTLKSRNSEAVANLKNLYKNFMFQIISPHNVLKDWTRFSNHPVCVYVCMHAYTHTHIRARAHTHTHSLTHTHSHTLTHTLTLTHSLFMELVEPTLEEAQWHESSMAYT
jgi:hypothetical protein